MLKFTHACRVFRAQADWMRKKLLRTSYLGAQWDPTANRRSFIWWWPDPVSQSVLRHWLLTEALFCYALFFVLMACVRYNLDHIVFIYDCYVKKNSYKSCRRKFYFKSPNTTCPPGDTVSELWRKFEPWHFNWQPLKNKSCFNWGKTWWHWSSIGKFFLINTIERCFCRQCMDSN
jgi:hypothetical protein